MLPCLETELRGRRAAPLNSRVFWKRSLPSNLWERFARCALWERFAALPSGLGSLQSAMLVGL